MLGDNRGGFYSTDARTGRILAVHIFPGKAIRHTGFMWSLSIVAGATIYLSNGTTVYAMPVERLAGDGS